MEYFKDDTSQLDEEVLGFRMTFTTNVGGEVLPVVPGGENIPVTEQNLEGYIQSVVDFYLDKYTEEEFLAFDEGFKAAANCDWLSMLEPGDIRLAVCGL